MTSLLLAAALFSKADYTVLEQDVAPKVSYAIDARAIDVRVENPHAKATGRLVVARGKAKGYKIDTFPATIEYAKDDLGEGPLRLALEVSWFRPDGTVRERRVYFAPRHMAGLPSSVKQIPVFDLKGHFQALADRNAGIRLKVESEKLKVERGRESLFYSLAVEDEKGRRIRNLVSGQPIPKTQLSTLNSRLSFQVEWDGRDDFGSPVLPGTYRYKGLVHAGVKPEFLMQFGNGDEGGQQEPFAWGPNHTAMTSLAANGAFVFVAAPLTEGGFALVALTPDGAFAKGFHQAHPYGADFVSIAADDATLYVALQGRVFSDFPRTDNRSRIGLVAYDLATGKVKGKTSYLYETPRAEAPIRAAEKVQMLTGLQFCGGSLYLANREANTVLEIDPATRTVVRTIPLEHPGALASDGTTLYAARGTDVVEIGRLPRTEIATSLRSSQRRGARNDEFKVTKLFSLPFEVTALSVRGRELAVLGAGDSTVRFYSRTGEARGTLGEIGGAYAGMWRPKRLVNPVDVLLAPDGTVWTTERRTNPKRVVRWSRAGEILYEKYGSPAYGSSSCGFDGEDASRIVAEGVEWKLDFDRRTATPVKVLTKTGLMGDLVTSTLQCQYVRYRGKTYIVSCGSVVMISEFKEDGSAKPVALYTNIHHFPIRTRAKNCPAFFDFIERRYLSNPKNDRNWRMNRRGCFWLDRNGNGDYEEDEFYLFPEGRIVMTHWGWTGMGLTLTLPFKPKGGEESLVTLAPDGFLPNGVLNYDPAKAVAEAKPIAAPLFPGVRGIAGETVATDLRGNAIQNSAPWMYSFAQDGRLNWHFPNKWCDVHGSHAAPLPQPGVLMGLLFATGTAPLDADGDVTAFIGNTGCVFLMTTDGLFIDRLFEDARVYAAQDFNLLGDEPFGGTFQYDKKRRQYLYQGGKNTYRLYRVRGLENVTRFSGECVLTREKIDAALRKHPEKAQEEMKAVRTTIPRVPNAGKTELLAAWQHDVLKCRVLGAYDEQNLVLRYQVEDPSPWRNTGKDWKMLFKTGDSVDFQLALDTRLTDKKRTAAAPGDIRLLIAPFDGGNAAVLYRHRLPRRADGAPRNDGEVLSPHGFSSPWRTHTVDDVRKLDDVKISVHLAADRYEVTAIVPLAALGVTADELKGVHTGDFGVIFGDNKGTVNMSRSYWSNKATGLVSDVPGEIIPPVHNWGKIEFR